MSLSFYLSYAGLWVLVIAQSLILLGVVRMVYQSQFPVIADGQLRRGQAAPPFHAVDLAGVPVASTDFAGRMAALLFVSPTCSSCAATLGELNALRLKAEGNVVVICRAGRDDCLPLVERYGLAVPIVADEDDRISQLLGVTANPTAVIIDAQGRIQAHGQPMRREELEEMIERVPEMPAREVSAHGDGEHGRGRVSSLEAR